MNIIKSIVFIGLLMNVQNVISITENNAEEKLSQEAEKVRAFLNSIDNINEDEKINIISYFNKPNVGEPVCIKNSPHVYENLFKKILQFGEMILFGYPLQQWIMAHHIEILRQGNCYNTEKREYPNHKIDKRGTAVAVAMRNNVKIPLMVDIPILTRDFSSQDAESWTDIARRSIYIGANKMDYCIEMNSSLNKQFPNTIPFRLAREYACLERGSWEPFKNLLENKICFGFLMSLTYHIIKGHKMKSAWKKVVGYGVAGILCGMIFSIPFIDYFQQQEQKACDLRAVELAEPKNVELEEFFTLEPEFVDISSGSDWAVKELKIKKLEKPLEFNIWGKSSPAQRLHYCKEYAEELYFPKVKKNNEVYDRAKNIIKEIAL